MDKIAENLEFSGVYVLFNYVNKKRYIGSSNNIRKRLWKHRSLLRGGCHNNDFLQKDWNLYGEDNFSYAILEKCPVEEHYKREQYYVDTMKPEYNICMDVIKPPSDVVSRQKHSETRKKLMTEGVIDITNNKPVYVYYKDGSFVGEWPSIRQAAKAIGIHYSSACRVIQGLDFQNSGYRLFTTEQVEVKPFKKPKGGSHPTVKFIIDDGISKVEVTGMKAVAEYCNSTPSTIRQYVNAPFKYKKKYTIIKATAVLQSNL